MKLNALSLFVVGAMMMFVTVAHADVVPPNTAGCKDKSAGDTCKTDEDKDGTCKSTDGALVCTMGSAEPAAGNEPAPDTGSGTDAGGAKDTATGGGGCSQVDTPVYAGIWLLLLAFGIFFTRRTHRKAHAQGNPKR